MLNKNPEMIKNASIDSTYSDIGGNLQFGDNNFFQRNADDLILRIQTYLNKSDFEPRFHKLFSEWVDELKTPKGIQDVAEIRHKFTLEEGKLLDVAKTKNDKLKIWLDRSPQRKEFKDKLINFCKPKEVCAFIFCISGQAEQDKIKDTSEMLQLYYFNEVMKNNSPEINKQIRINDPVYLKNDADAQGAFDTILRDLLKLDIYFDNVEIIKELEKKFQHQRIVVRCNVREWEKEGLSSFFELWQANIKRQNRYPFLLFMEFNDTDYEKLDLILKDQFCDTSVTLLPKLDKVIAQDVTDFYARTLILENQEQGYDDIFDRNSLRTLDTPLYYRDAINKLQLK